MNASSFATKKYSVTIALDKNLNRNKIDLTVDKIRERFAGIRSMVENPHYTPNEYPHNGENAQTFSALADEMKKDFLQEIARRPEEFTQSIILEDNASGRIDLDKTGGKLEENFPSEKYLHNTVAFFSDVRDYRRSLLTLTEFVVLAPESITRMWMSKMGKEEAKNTSISSLSGRHAAIIATIAVIITYALYKLRSRMQRQVSQEKCPLEVQSENAIDPPRTSREKQ